MPGIPDRYESSFRTLQQLTAQLHQMIESGEFHTLSLSARRKLLRNVKRLYNRLAGPISSRVLVGAVTAGVLLLAGCFQPTVPDLDPDPDPEPEPEPPAQVFVPAFSTVAQPNPYSISFAPGNELVQLQPVFADLDSDGDPDLAYPFMSYTEGAYAYHGIQYHQDGATAFDPVSYLGLYRGSVYGDIADLRGFVDLDADGDLDAVLSGRYNNGYFTEYGVLVAYNSDFQDDGVLDAPEFYTEFTVGPFSSLGGNYAKDVAFTDIDGDGDVDMLYLNYVESAPPEALLSLNTGTAQAPDFQPGIASEYIDSTVPYSLSHSVEVVDLDNDGDVDLLVGTYFDDTVVAEPRILFYENISTPTAVDFAPAVVNPFGLTFPGSYLWGAAAPYGGGVGIAAADVDGDGDMDLLVGPYSTYRGMPYYDYASTFLFFENTGGMVDVVE